MYGNINPIVYLEYGFLDVLAYLQIFQISLHIYINQPAPRNNVDDLKLLSI